MSAFIYNDWVTIHKINKYINTCEVFLREY